MLLKYHLLDTITVVSHPREELQSVLLREALPACCHRAESQGSPSQPPSPNTSAGGGTPGLYEEQP